jgi:hypothetical protein
MFDGEKVGDDDSPDSLGLEENDLLDVQLEAVGGSN